MGGQLHYTVLPVGQGDGNYVELIDDNGNIVFNMICDLGSNGTIDGGRKENKEQILEYLRSRIAKRKYPGSNDTLYLDILSVSHADTDHWNFLHGLFIDYILAGAWVSSGQDLVSLRPKFQDINGADKYKMLRIGQMFVGDNVSAFNYGKWNKKGTEFEFKYFDYDFDPDVKASDALAVFYRNVVSKKYDVPNGAEYEWPKYYNTMELISKTLVDRRLSENNSHFMNSETSSFVGSDFTPWYADHGLTVGCIIGGAHSGNDDSEENTNTKSIISFCDYGNNIIIHNGDATHQTIVSAIPALQKLMTEEKSVFMMTIPHHGAWTTLFGSTYYKTTVSTGSDPLDDDQLFKTSGTLEKFLRSTQSQPYRRAFDDVENYLYISKPYCVVASSSDRSSSLYVVNENRLEVEPLIGKGVKLKRSTSFCHPISCVVEMFASYVGSGAYRDPNCTPDRNFHFYSTNFGNTQDGAWNVGSRAGQGLRDKYQRKMGTMSDLMQFRYAELIYQWPLYGNDGTFLMNFPRTSIGSYSTFISERNIFTTLYYINSFRPKELEESDASENDLSREGSSIQLSTESFPLKTIKTEFNVALEAQAQEDLAKAKGDLAKGQKELAEDQNRMEMDAKDLRAEKKTLLGFRERDFKSRPGKRKAVRITSGGIDVKNAFSRWTIDPNSLIFANREKRYNLNNMASIRKIDVEKIISDFTKKEARLPIMVGWKFIISIYDKDSSTGITPEVKRTVEMLAI